MPFLIRRPSGRRGHALLAIACAAAAGAVLAAPASAATTCTTPSLAKVFAPWQDFADYTLLPAGDFEGAMAGWTLSGGAKVVTGNETFQVGGKAHGRSLSLPVGAVVVSAPICIDETYPSFRFFARRAGAGKSALTVDVLWVKSGATRVKNAKLDRAVELAWAPAKAMRLPASKLIDREVMEPVVFRFTVTGSGPGYQVDDVYVDPFSRR